MTTTHVHTGETAMYDPTPHPEQTEASRRLRLARQVIATLDAQQKFFKNRGGRDAQQLLAEAKDHERRLRAAASEVIEESTRTPSIFDDEQARTNVEGMR